MFDVLANFVTVFRRHKNVCEHNVRGFLLQSVNCRRSVAESHDPHAFVDLKDIPVGPDGTAKRIVYRTAVNRTDDYRVAFTLDNNTARGNSDVIALPGGATFKARLDADRGAAYNGRQFAGSA